MTPPELLRQQMLRMLDGELPVEEIADLEANLKADPQARRDWWRLARIHSALESRFASEAAIQQLPMVPIERVIAMQRRRTFRIALVAAAAVFVIAMTTLWTINAVDLRPTVASVQAAPGSDFILVHPEGSRKKTAQKPRLRPGSMLSLTHGVAELELPHDVRAVVQAPARLTLIDARTVRLDEGMGWFEVGSADGHGFTVVTPQQKIVDLGTAFGIVAGRVGSHVDLHVFDGRVRVDPLIGEPGEIISAGRAVRLESTHIREDLEIDRAAFLDELPQQVETLFEHDFSKGLPGNREFAVLMDPGTILSEAGVPFPGIADNKEWSFQTASAAPANIAVRNSGFEEDGGPVQKGVAIAHWENRQKFEWGWGVDQRRGSLAATEGRFFGRVFRGRRLEQVTDETIRPATTYVLTLDVGLENSAALVRLKDHDSDAVLAEARFQSAGSGWQRNASLVFTTPDDHPVGGRIAISLTCDEGEFAAFDHIRLGISGDGAGDEWTFPEASPSEEKSGLPPRDSGMSAPQIIDLLPAAGASSATPGGPLMIRFDQPVEWGRGRIILRNINDWTETSFVAGGDPRLSLVGAVLVIHPPLALADGEIQMGRVPGWHATGWVGLRGRKSDSRGGSKHAISALIDAAVPSSAIRREIGMVPSASRLTASVSLRHPDSSPPFPGYHIRLLSGEKVLAERGRRHLPGKGKSVCLAWDSADLPADVAPGGPLTLEIAPARVAPGHLEIESVRVTAVPSP